MAPFPPVMQRRDNRPGTGPGPAAGCRFFTGENCPAPLSTGYAKRQSIALFMVHCRNAGEKEKGGDQMPGDHRFFLAIPRTTHRTPIPRTGMNGGRGVCVGEAGTLTITTTGSGAGVGVAENTAGMLVTAGIDTPVPLLSTSDIEWHVPS